MEINNKEYQTVILAALLHDVGKIFQGGSFGNIDTAGQHPQVSAHFVTAFKGFFSKFVNFDLLLTLVQRHHDDPRYFKENLLCKNAPEEYRALSYLVSQADNYSSSETDEQAESFQDFKATPMVSIFSRIRLEKEPPDTERYRLMPLSAEKSFPEKFDTYRDDEYNKHLQGFSKEFTDLVKAFENIANPDFNVVFSNMLSILQQYTWCIPSNKQEEISDISLFDHLKTTCAIASCLYYYHAPILKEAEIKDATTDKFLLLVGDISGIQKYIFNITHIGAGGIAKRLRSRSFQLNITSEIISHKILHAFHLSTANILMVSGGKFYILLPKTEHSENKIILVKKEVDSWLYKSLNAEVNVNISTMPLSGNDFECYGDVMKKINGDLQQIKKMPFKSLLTDQGHWQENLAVLNVHFADEEKLCKACGRFPGQEKEEGKFICDRCNDDKGIGQNLPKIKLIAFYRDSAGAFGDYFGYSFDLLSSQTDVKDGAYLLMSIDEPIQDYKVPVAHRFIANYIPKFIVKNDCETCKNVNTCLEKEDVIAGQPKFFECIAQKSTGRKMLGYLKADVDNLGAVFAFGLKEENIVSVSRIASLSRMLDVFFSGYMQKMIGDKYPDIYTVYSGGDDILVIGPWDSIVSFAKELNAEFRRFTCSNKNLTLSAGIAFVKHRHPVFRAIEMADNALDASKDAEKNRLTVFGQTIKWEEVPEIIEESEKLKEWLKINQVSSGFAQNLLTYSQMNNVFKMTGKTEYLRFLPLMTYDIARNLPSLDNKDQNKKEIREWAESLKDLTGTKLKNLGIIANYALMANRGGKDE